MYKNNGYQGSSLFNSSNRTVASIYKAASNVKEYLLLKEENGRLSRENAMLHNLLKSGYAAIPVKEYIKHDTLYKQKYSFVSAKVVNSSVNKRSNYLTLDAGSKQGIERDMAIINSDGVVGIVKDVSENFASVMSLLHKDVRVNCQLKSDRSYGPLIWDGNDYRYCSLTDIPTHAKIKKGDTVITSELSGTFPEGIDVGTIESYERKQNQPFYTVKIKLFADFKKLNYVLIIKNRFKNEKDSLEAVSHTQNDK